MLTFLIGLIMINIIFNIPPRLIMINITVNIPPWVNYD